MTSYPGPMAPEIQKNAQSLKNKQKVGPMAPENHKNYTSRKFIFCQEKILDINGKII